MAPLGADANVVDDDEDWVALDEDPRLADETDRDVTRGLSGLRAHGARGAVIAGGILVLGYFAVTAAVHDGPSSPRSDVGSREPAQERARRTPRRVDRPRGHRMRRTRLRAPRRPVRTRAYRPRRRPGRTTPVVVPGPRDPAEAPRTTARQPRMATPPRVPAPAGSARVRPARRQPEFGFER